MSFKYRRGEGKPGDEWIRGFNGSACLLQRMGRQVRALLLRVIAEIINNCLNEAIDD